MAEADDTPWALSSAATEVLGQLFLRGPTLDGNIASKAGRSELFEAGLADRVEGFTFLTRTGVDLALRYRGGWKDWAQKIRGV